MKKHILRIIVTVLILAVIGGGTWFFFFKPSDNAAIYNKLAALSESLNEKNSSIQKLKSANSISVPNDVAAADKDKYKLNNIKVSSASGTDNIYIFKDVTLIRSLIFEGGIEEFKLTTVVDNYTKNNYDSMYAKHNNLSDEKNNIIQTDELNVYTHEMFVNKAADINKYSINHLFYTLDSAFNYYVMLAKTATGASKSVQDEINNAINKYNSALNACSTSINEIIAYQKLINLDDATIGSTKVYTLTRMYGDLKNNFMTMFTNYVNLILKVKDYDVKYVFNNKFVHDMRTAGYESALYAINNMASRPSELKAEKQGSLLNIDSAWYSAFYDACVVVDTFSMYSTDFANVKTQAIDILEKIYPYKFPENILIHNKKITSKYNYLLKNFTELEKQFVISFNNLYEKANQLITETKLDGASLFVKNNLAKTKIAVGDSAELAGIAEEFRNDAKIILSFLGFKEFIVTVPAVKGA